MSFNVKSWIWIVGNADKLITLQIRKIDNLELKI